MSVSALIKEGAAQLSLALSAEQLAQAEGFLALLEKWNQAMNLTGIDDAAQGVGLHLMDSFASHQHITGASICDLGSGAGVPGIPLAILLPGKDFILLDSNAKKTHFMTQARIELKLNNITVVQDRVETWQGKFDHLVCRAYAHLNKIVSAS
ncbi:MAG: 16S rRNA (guanine(527)-N(7))-methyltransferase RsmG, partial [Pseudomonadales bacterium]